MVEQKQYSGGAYVHVLPSSSSSFSSSVYSILLSEKNIKIEEWNCKLWRCFMYDVGVVNKS